MNASYSEFFRRFWSHPKTSSTIKIALTFASAIALAVVRADIRILNDLILGILAAALAESEERPRDEIRQQLLTLLCFALTTFGVRALVGDPVWLLVGLIGSSFALVMLGAVSESYGRIANATQTLGIYTLISATRHGHDASSNFREPLLLLTGFGLYSAWALLWVTLFPARPARQALASVYRRLGDILLRKAELLEPIPSRAPDPLTLSVADTNTELVTRMNSTRQLILGWMRGGSPSKEGERLLRLYLLAQSIHERISSSHEDYGALTRALGRTDLLFRCAHLLRTQAAACAELATAIALDRDFVYGDEGLHLLDELAASLAHLETHVEPETRDYLETARDLVKNVAALDRLLSNAGRPEALLTERETTLRDHEPHTFAEAFRRVREQASSRSPRFRHAIRLASALGSGYLLLLIFPLRQGYWVLLTTVFVLRPTYSGTWSRLSARVFGTLLGLVASWSLLQLIPDPRAQLGIAVLAGVAFVYLRNERYLGATASMTVLVFLLLNQLGASQAYFWPRLLDTIVGALLAGLTVLLILPDWQGRKLPTKMGKTLRAASRYLEEVLLQYSEGKEDHLRYRIARREAHEAEADLAQTLTATLGEPDDEHISAEACFGFRAASHTLLAYISALGAHREGLSEGPALELAQRSGKLLLEALQALAQAYEEKRAPESQWLAALPQEELASVPSHTTRAERRLLRQLALMTELLPSLAKAAEEPTESRAVPGTNAATTS